MNDALQTAIARKLAQFTADLVELYRVALHDAVAQVVGAQGGRPAPTRGAPRQRRAAAPSKASRGRVRRSADQIDALAARIEKHVASHPGASAIEIKQALGIAPNEWNRPIAKLIADKKLRTTGAKRATKYHPTKG